MTDQYERFEATADVSGAIETMNRMGQSPGGQFSWQIAKVLATLLITGSIALATGYVKDIRDATNTLNNKLETQGQTLGAQDKAQSLQAMRIDGLQKVSDATVTALQALGAQVSHNTYDVESLKSQQALNAVRSRPGR